MGASSKISKDFASFNMMGASSKISQDGIPGGGITCFHVVTDFMETMRNAKVAYGKHGPM